MIPYNSKIMTNLYEELGVSQEASESEIKSAYRKLSLKYHPDRNQGDPSAEEKYKGINGAYEVLSDPDERKKYDHHLRFGGDTTSFQNGSSGTSESFHGEMGDINNIINMMFGQGFPGQGGQGGPGIRVFHSSNGQGFPGQGFPGQGFPGFPGQGNNPFEHLFQQMQKPPPIMKTIQVNLEDVYKGATIPIEFERQTSINGVKTSEIKTLNIEIPRGMDENEIFLLRDQGHNLNNQISGDIKINIQFNKHAIFKRQGIDLIFIQELSLKESLCGFAFEILHLNGKTLSMNNRLNPTIVKPSYKKVVNQMGFTKDSSVGNLIIEFVVNYPDSLSQTQIEALQNIL